MRAPPDTRSLAESSHISSGSTRRSWLALARGAWIVCALVLLANFVASIPAYYQVMRTACSLANQGQCTGTFEQLTPANVAALAHLHLSLTSYAAYFVILDVVISLLPWGIGLLIFWRKSAEGMGLFVSLLLVLFGAAGSANTLLGIWAPTPSPPLLSLTQSHFGRGMDWPGGISLDVSHRTLYAALVLAHLLVLDHYVCVANAPTFPRSPSILDGIWRDAFHHGLPLCPHL